MKTSSERAGELLHAKHAYQPNNLGYCGPDENRRLLDFLHGRPADGLLRETFEKFEAAYPFIRMIGESTGRSPYDREVTEAYWIGNRLLDRVGPPDFFEFARAGLKSRMKAADAKMLFNKLGALAKPHHTFYVLGIYSRAAEAPASSDKLLSLMDSCRISWGRVVEVKERSLLVDRSPLRAVDGQLTIAKPELREVAYDNEIAPFQRVRRGDWVSIHWDFASEKLSTAQLRNVRKYTNLDIEAANAYSDMLRGSRR